MKLFDDFNASIVPYNECYIKTSTFIENNHTRSNKIKVEILDEEFEVVNKYFLNFNRIELYDPRVFLDEGIISVSCHEGGFGNQLFYSFELDGYFIKIKDFLFDARSIKNDKECKNIILKQDMLFYDFSRNNVFDINYNQLQKTPLICSGLRGGSNIIQIKDEYVCFCHRLEMENGKRKYSAYKVNMCRDKLVIKTLEKININPFDYCDLPLNMYTLDSYFKTLKEVVFPTSCWEENGNLYVTMGLNDFKTLIMEVR